MSAQFLTEHCSRVPTCNCLLEKAETKGGVAVVIKHPDIATADAIVYSSRDFRDMKVFLKHNYCPQCGKPYTIQERLDQ